MPPPTLAFARALTQDALRAALEGYYKYLALGSGTSKNETTRWSEPYTSIPNVFGSVTSVCFLLTNSNFVILFVYLSSII